MPERVGSAGDLGDGEETAFANAMVQLRDGDPFLRACAFEFVHETLLDPTRRGVRQSTASVLIGLLLDDTVQDRHRIASLLGELVRSPTAHAVAPVVASLVERTSALLQAPDSLVRSAVAYLLGGVQMDSRASALVQQVLKQEVDPIAASSQILCLSAWEREFEPSSSMRNDVRVASAQVLAHEPEWVLQNGLEEALVAAALLPRESADVLRANESSMVFPWGSGVWARLAVSSLSQIERLEPALACRVLHRSLEARHARGERLPQLVTPDALVLERLLDRSSDPRRAGELDERVEERQRTPPIIPPEQLDESGSVMVLVDLAARFSKRHSAEPEAALRYGALALRDLVATKFPSDFVDSK